MLLRDYQGWFRHGILQAMKDGYKSVLAVLPTGCHAAGQKIIMYDGSLKAVEDISVGDQLLGTDSTPRTVLCLHRGIDEMYRVHPVKGASFVVNSQHVLTLDRTRESSVFPCRFAGKLIDIKLCDWLDLSPWRRHLLKLVRTGGVDFSTKEYSMPLSPYFVGIVLGDGGMSGRSCTIRAESKEVLAAFVSEAARYGHPVNVASNTATDTAPSYGIAGGKRGSPNRVCEALRSLGMMGCKAATKFIPDPYKLSNRENRLDLLAGLMDTDGYLHRGGYDYISKSQRLASDVAFVARSVGLAAYVSPCEKMSQNGNGGTYYRVSISGDCTIVPCRIPRKIAPDRKQKKSVLRTGFKVENLGKGQFYGFTLDGDGRYLMNDFTITHNSGKRYVIVDLCLLAMQHNRKVLVATNRRLLVDQMVKECHEHGVHYGVIMSDYLEGDPGAPIQIASIQTIQSWYLKPRLGGEPGVGLPHWDLLLIDEAHAGTDSYDQLRSLRPDAKTVGFTATPIGTEGRSLVTSKFSRMVEGSTNTQLIAQGHLLPTVVYAPSEPNIEGVKIAKGQEYNQKQLGRAVRECTVFADVYSEWEKLAHDRATVAFVPGIPFGRDLVRQFNFLLGAGTAHLIEAKTKHHERQEIFAKIQSGESRIVVSCDILREGFDLPVLSCAVDLQPNSQLRSYWQKIGRIKRPYVSQDHALYLDFAGNYWKFPHPNEDPIWPQGEEETTQDVIKASRKAATASQPISCPKCSFVRTSGQVCPNCSYKAEGAIRRIRMGHGKLKEIPAYAKEKVEKTESERLFGKWQSRLFGALRSGITYAQCAAIFYRETGQMPKPHWVGAYPENSVRSKGKPQRDFTSRDLSIACRQSPK